MLQAEYSLKRPLAVQRASYSFGWLLQRWLRGESPS